MFHYLLAAFISDKKSVVVFIFVLSVLFCFFFLFSRLTFYPWFSAVLLGCALEGVFVFFLLWVHQASWIFILYYFVNILARYFFSLFYCAPISLSPPSGFQLHVCWTVTIYPEILEALFSFFPTLFFPLCFHLDDFFSHAFKFTDSLLCCFQSANKPWKRVLLWYHIFYL